MLTLSLIDGVDGGTLLLLIAAIAVALYLRYLNKRYPNGETAPTSEPLTEERINRLSDEDLVRAAVLSILAKTDRRRPDVYALLPTLSHGQTAVYSVWVVCNELENAPFADMLHSPSGRFGAAAADGFSLIGAAACEQAMIAVMELPDDDTALRSAIEGEQPLARCAAYIRDNPAEFL